MQISELLEMEERPVDSLISQVTGAGKAMVDEVQDMQRRDNGHGGVTLREYIDMRLREQKDAVAAALIAADRAISKAEIATDKRLESMNEFRAALSDSARLQMPRSEAEQAMKTINDKLNGALLAVNDKLEVLSSRQDARDDRSRGMNQGWIVLTAAIGIITSVVSAVFVLFFRT